VILDALSSLGSRQSEAVLDVYGKGIPADPYARKLKAQAASSGLKVNFKGTFPMT